MQRIPKDNSVYFFKTKELYGELSNMCSGFPISVNGEIFKTSEALYQAMKFPYHDEIQKKIKKAHSPMATKFIVKDHQDKIRNDWESIKVDVMKWCLRAKLVCHWDKLGQVLESTDNKTIVELSYKDNFWGAKLTGEYFEGQNMLGKLLMELRDDYRKTGKRNGYLLKPLKIEDFLLNKEPIQNVTNETIVSHNLLMLGGIQ